MKAFPQVWGMQQMKEKGFLDQGLLYYIARAHFGSSSPRGKILVISCHFEFNKQSFKHDFYTGIAKLAQHEG